MTARTSFDTHSDTIDSKRKDALAFIELGSLAAARRVQLEILSLYFGGVTSRELIKLFQTRDAAIAEINAAMESARAEVGE